MIRTPIQIRFNDLDPMGRVNNSIYSSYLEIARMDFIKKHFSINELKDTPFVLVRVEIDLKRSILLGDEIEIYTWVSKIKTTSWEFSYVIQSIDNLKIYAYAKTIQIFFDYHKNEKKTISGEMKSILLSHFKEKF
jgi:acyl-CoA thioester hydrolase